MLFGAWLLITVSWAWVLLERTSDWMRWLRFAVVIVGVVAADSADRALAATHTARTVDGATIYDLSAT